MGFTVQQKAEFTELYNSACMAGGSEDRRLVQLKDQMVPLLVAANEARLKYVHPKALVPHIKNRGGSKMQWAKIFKKGAKIIKVGVSLGECGPSKAIAFEDDPSRTMALEHIKLCKTSPHYADYTDPEIVEGGSVGCGHWNQFLACIIDKKPVPLDLQKVLCESGNPNLDPERLSRDQPVLKPLLTTGLQVTMIKRSIEVDFPQLPHILQKALNVEHNIGEGSTQMISTYVKRSSSSRCR